MKQHIDFTEKRVLSELRNAFESYQTSLRERKTNIKMYELKSLLYTLISIEFNLNHIFNSSSEMKLYSSKFDKNSLSSKTGLSPNFQSFQLEICSFQTDLSEDSDIEWFDAEDIKKDDLIESSSDEVTDQIDQYPISFRLKQDIKLVKKIVSISEKDAWIISSRKLLKIVNHSLQDDVYAEIVDDIRILKDCCVLVLRSDDSFVRDYVLVDG
ncbi:unnamed protein product [Mytilus edulis]|uniref:Uncharacterized protein n=1 Tax=Mytilus edulis TaxID=6550 RepID=A0A8S3V0X3_MYTED|nr:unnamed protein product [Mytilus edulis]